ncbi:hypothetical protein F2Q70_00039380 [Brassica cretica]|uniref:Flavodoxin-like domain-containing protein n=1 Tax=Brassica cretica TaxID=69181 RepID=A0A8S9KAJ6_BRACR|nr:hypothetical protein F2Q70_00039380 [Brassica cretica]
MTLKRASFTSSLFIVSSFQLHIYHPPPFSVHLKAGNALDAAERISLEAERRGCPASIVSNDEFDSSSLPHEDAILFVVSTTGQGDSPDSFKEFWRFLLQRNLGNSWLQRVRFAVFGLGDSGYQKYNFVTKKLDKRLLDLGATTIIEKGLGDDKHPSWYRTSSGCVACYREPRSTKTSLNDPLTNSVAQTVKKPSVSENFWSTSTVDMDNITFPSQGGSISSS